MPLFGIYREVNSLFELYYFLVNSRSHLTRWQRLQFQTILIMWLIANHPYPHLFWNLVWLHHRLLNPSLVPPQARVRGTFRIQLSPSVVRALTGCMKKKQVDVCCIYCIEYLLCKSFGKYENIYFLHTIMELHVLILAFFIFNASEHVIYRSLHFVM